jgi:hypothetical protein
MNRSLFQAVIFLSLCPLLMAQQPTQDASTSAAAQPAQAVHITGSLQLTQDAATAAVFAERLALMKQREAEQPHYTGDFNRNTALKNARTIFICSQTDFLTNSTMQRALFNQKDWEKLGLNILNQISDADLELQINRLVFTHIHTYILTDRKSGVVLASGRIRAFDGVVASGPMAEQIVKILSAARVQAPSTSSNPGF